LLLIQDGKSMGYVDKWMSFVERFDAFQMSRFSPRLTTSLWINEFDAKTHLSKQATKMYYELL
jgi:hypothetical protein